MVGIVGVIALLLGIFGGIVYQNATSQNIYAQFEVPDQDIGAVCPGAVIRQSNFMTANGPAVLNLVATIYDSEGVNYAPVARNYWLAVPNGEVITDNLEWVAPDLPPKKYKRVLAANSESIRPPAISITHFEVVECDDAGSHIEPEPTP